MYFDFEKLNLSGYVTDGDGSQDCIEIENGQQHIRHELKSDIEEADARIIPHVAFSIRSGTKRVVVLSNDTDVVVLLLYYFNQFLSMGVQQLWIKFGTGDNSRYIPIHTLADKLGENNCQMVLKVHGLTGCDVTSKLGTKAAGMKADIRQLVNFGVSELVDPSSFVLAEKYLCGVLYPNESCQTFDTLRYRLYTKKNKDLSSLPPTSHVLYGHLLRSHYFVWTCHTLLTENAATLNPQRFGWNLVDNVLIPDKHLCSLPEIYTATCRCNKKCTGRCMCKKNGTTCTEYCNCSEGGCVY